MSKLHKSKPMNIEPSSTTKEEATNILSLMKRASAGFYCQAVKAGCHSFIEFTGLMNEYIKVCEDMTAKGDFSWVMANTHSNQPLQMQSFQVTYLAEKLDCIYGPTLRQDDIFLKAIGAPIKKKARAGG